MPELRVVGEAKVNRYLLEDSCTIGRHRDCEIRIEKQAFSRFHARIEKQGDHFLLKDMGSHNGIFLNSKKLDEPELLTDGDTIHICGVEFIFVVFSTSVYEPDDA